MGTLSYTAIMSIDGYVADADGDFQWAAPGDDVFRFHVDRLDAVSTEVLGRRTYELMRYWETDPDDGSWSDDEHEFARRWRGLDLVVASSTLAGGGDASDRARVVGDLSLSTLHEVVDEARGEVEIFGPTTAASAIRAGVVSDYRFVIVPRIVGGGLRAMPDGAHLDLQLAQRRAFENGTVLLHYRSVDASSAWPDAS